MMYKLFLAFTLLFLFNNAVTAQQSIDNLVGEWTGSGKLFGQDASFSMKWEKALGGKFIRLVFQNNFTQNGKKNTMDAEAMYKPVSDSSFEGSWFDSRGVVLPLKAVFSGSTLTAQWGSPETETGKTVYLVKSNNEIEVTDFVQRNGQWQQFGKAVYTKK
jgi:hypothetical protein